MADFMLQGDINLSPIQQKVKALQSELQAIQRANANAGIAVPQLPKKVLQQIAQPNIPAGIAKGDDAAIRRAVKAQAELVALKLQEFRVNQRLLTGQTVDFKSGEAQKLKNQLLAGGRGGLESSLGFSLDPQQKKLFADQVRKRIDRMDAQIRALPIEDQAKAFAEVSRPTLTPGIGPAKVRAVDTVAAKIVADEATAAAAQEQLGRKAASDDLTKALRARAAQERLGTKLAAQADADLAAGKGSARQLAKYNSKQALDKPSLEPILGPTRSDFNSVVSQYDKDYDTAFREKARLERDAKIKAARESLNQTRQYNADNPLLGPTRADYNKALTQYDRDFEAAHVEKRKREQAAIAKDERERNRLTNQSRPTAPTQQGFFGRVKTGLGLGEGGTGVGNFFGAGFATTLKYAIPSAALFGSFRVISDAVKDAEELAVTFTKIESQLQSIGREDTFGQVKEEIIALSKATGIEAAILGDVRLQLAGAFQDSAFSAKDPTGSFGGLKGSDDIIRYGDEAVKKQLEAAAKLSVVTGISEAELVDGLTAASLAFGASADRVGDVAVKLETATGVKAKETIAFLGDIGPSARDAGFSLEEFAAIAAQVQKRSGQSGATIAEQLGRVLVAIKDNKSAFLDIAQANEDVFGGNYDDFVKNIQQGNTRGVFNQLASSFEDLNQGSKDFIVNLIGGQRQANTLLAAFGDSAGLSRTIDAANSATGELDLRFNKLQDRISLIFKRIKTSFNDFAKTIIDSGLGDIFATILSSLEKILNVAIAVVKPIGSFNKALGGAPAKIAAIALELAAVNKLIQLIAGTGLISRVGANVAANGLVRGGGGSLLGGAAAVGSAIFPSVAPTYRQSLIGANAKYGPGFVGPVAESNSALRASVTSGAKVKAAGSALLSAAGGPLGIGLIAAVSAYGIISNNLDEDRKRLEEIRVRTENSDKSAEELITEARKMRASRSGFYKAWHEIFDVAAPEDVKEIVAINKQSSKARNQLSNAYSVQPDDLNKIARENFGAESKAISDIQNNFAVDYFKQKFPEQFLTLPFKSLTGKDLLKDFQKDSPIAVALNGKTPIEDLQKIAKGDDPKLVAEANDYLKQINKLAEKDPKTAKLYAQLQTVPGRLANATGDLLLTAVGDIEAAFANGDISLSTYISTIETKLANLEAIPRDKRSEADGKAIAQLQKLLLKPVTDRILQVQDEAAQIRKLYGESEDQSTYQAIQTGLQNLNNDKFKGTDAQFEVAKGLLENVRKFYSNIVSITGDLSLAQKLLTEGFEVPEEIRRIVFQRQIEQSDQYTDLKKFVQEVRSDDALRKRFGIPDLGPSNQLKSFLDEFFSEQGVSPETITNLQNRYNKEALALNDPDLSVTKKNAIKGDMEFVAELLGLVGVIPSEPIDSQSIIKSFNQAMNVLTGRGGLNDIINTASNIILGALPGNRLANNAVKNFNDAFADIVKAKNGGAEEAFGVLTPEEIAKLGPEEAKKVIDDLEKGQNAIFGIREAQLKGNTVAIAQLRKAQAKSQAERANLLPPGLERDIAIAEAETARLEADTEFENAVKAVSDAQRGYAKALADDAGDLVGVAQEGLAQAQADLAFAKSQGDAAGVANAQAAIVAANKEVRQAIAAQRDAQAAYLKAVITKDDPLKQAQFDLNLAKIQETEARGATEKANAALKVLEAERAVRDAMSETRQAIFNLREAQLKSIDDDVGAANVAAQAARAQLQDAIARGAGQAEIANLQAGIINADKTARDTLFQDQMDEYKYLLDTGKLTKFQYIKYLEGLQQTLQPGTKQFKDLEVTLRQLKNDIGQDLQANLPTALGLPTLYETRRLGGVNEQNPTGPGRITGGYSDNRVQDIKVYVTKDMSTEQVLQVLTDAMGTGRNSPTAVSRY
jgi:TP901 family phage tail tape measure protein